MITGPSIGPAMVLTVLMRWPALIAVCAVGASGVFIRDRVDMDQLKSSVYSFAKDKVGVDIPQTLASAEKEFKDIQLVPRAEAHTNDAKQSDNLGKLMRKLGLVHDHVPLHPEPKPDPKTEKPKDETS